MTTEPLIKPVRRQLKLRQFAAPLNIVVSEEGVAISVASYSTYCHITWTQLISVMLPPDYSDHRSALEHLREQVEQYKVKQAKTKVQVAKDKKKARETIDREAFWNQRDEERRALGLHVRKKHKPRGPNKPKLQTLQSTDTPSPTSGSTNDEGLSKL